MTRRPLAVILAILLTLSAFGVGASLVAVGREPEPAAVAAALTPVRLSLDPDSLEATAAVLYDPTTGTMLFQKDAQEPLPLASLTKLMTAYTVLAARATSTVVTITPDDLAPDGDWGLEVGDELSIDLLLRLGLVASSNDAMQAVAESLGSNYLANMNRVAQSLGLTSMRFYNPTGLDLDLTTAGAYGSAYDVARLATDFYNQHPEYFELSTQPYVSIPDGDRELSAIATTVPLQDIPGFVAAKTGYTDLAGGNLAAIFDLEPGHPVVAVVLHSTEDGRFDDIRTIITAARAAMAQ